MKKFLCTLIAICFLLTAMAFAEGKSNTLDEIGIKPFGENFDASEYITRAEFAKIMCMMTNMIKTAELSFSGGVTFPDVDGENEYAPYINLCKDKGVICGFEDGTYRPDDGITAEQAAKIIIYELGYKDAAERYGGYPHGYMIEGSKLGIFVGTENIELNKNITKGDALIMLSNSVDIPFLMQVTFGENAEFAIMNGEDGKAHYTIRRVYFEDIYPIENNNYK